jgi:Tol biopolymer transport system component/DNA-binding CsgD family transcriptional regulator
MTSEPSRRKRGRPPHPDILTPREWQVLDLLRQDLTNEQIAQRLDISPAGAKCHVSEILSKLGVSTREAAAAWQPPTGRAPWWERATAPVAATLRRLSPLTLAKVALLGAALLLVAGLAILISGVSRTEPGDAQPLAAAPCLNRPPGGTQAARQLFVATYIDSNVWFVDADGGSGQPVIAGTGPEWSPDGRALAFLDSTHDGLHFRAALCVVQADGTSARSLGQVFQGDNPPSCIGGTQYAWSLDGTMLVYENDGMMYTASLEEGSLAPEELTHGSGPTLSPDGKKVAFSSITPAGRFAYCGIWVVYTDDRDRHELLFAKGTAPAFSPEGDRIAFVDGAQIMLGDAEGAASTVLADFAPGKDLYDGPRELIWARDGERIAFAYDSPGNGGPLVYVVNADGSGEPIEIGEGHQISWSPDGEFLAFSQPKYEADAKSTLYVARADGRGEPKKIGEGGSPSWSPDGTRIAFTR